MGLDQVFSIEEIFSIYFEHLKRRGLDIDQPLRWSFTFVDPKREKLDIILQILTKSGYRSECIKQQTSNANKWTLTVSKTEVLSMDKFRQRNNRLQQLADHYKIELYEGWHVEK